MSPENLLEIIHADLLDTLLENPLLRSHRPL